MLGFPSVFLPMLHNSVFLSFSALTYVATGTWREGERSLKMKEARGNQFKCETENAAKVCIELSFSDTQKINWKKNQIKRNETGLDLDFLYTEVVAD